MRRAPRCPLRLPILAALLSAAACLTPGAAPAADVRLTLLHTTDLHGRLTNAVPDEGEAPEAGLLRIASLVRQIRAENPNTLLVDCGDTLQGTPDSRATNGALMIEAMRRTGYDAWLPGNHEFDWGLEKLRGALRDPPCPMLGAVNILARPGTTHALPQLRTHLVREVGGVRVLLVGLTSPGIPGWLLPDYLGDLQFERSATALGRAMPALRAERADVMVLMMHQGNRPDFENEVNEAASTAAQFPEFDVVLGGHTHEAIESDAIGGALFTQAGCHGQWLGRVDLTWDTTLRRVTSRRSRLISVDALVQVDPGVAKAVGPGLHAALAPLDTRVGELATPLAAGSSGAGGTERLLRAAVATAANAAIVIHGALSEAPLAAGPVLERDLWRVVPFENRIGVAMLNLRELREILEETLDQAGMYHRSGVQGLVVEIRPAGTPGPRVGRITLPDGTIPHSNLRMATAFNSYMLASGGGRFRKLREITQRPEARLRLTEADTRDAVRDYLKAHPGLREGDLPAAGFRIE